jgi:hypothetical protein
MRRGLRRQGPALVLAGLALMVALSGTVYAAAKINGKTIKVKSLPGNRLAMGSVPGNRLKPGAIRGGQLAPGSITGIHIDTSTLGIVPRAAQAERAQLAEDAELATHALSAEDAEAVNGYKAGCKSGTEAFAGACWQSDPSVSALTAPAAAASCASEGGELPDALSLAAFSQRPGVVIAPGDEWTGDLTNVSDVNLYAAITVSPAGAISSALSTATKRFRCVIPLLS